ncbi:MAG: hypothetical protein KIS92_06985 [Planctomycetota bacterium]|nr:hypothetical protein [Planctomycetota bacterium]
MPIIVVCQHCGKKNRAPDQHAGKMGRCSGCQKVLRIPAAETVAPEPEARPAVQRSSRPAMNAAPPPKAGPAISKSRPAVEAKAARPGRSGAVASTPRPARARRKTSSVIPMAVVGALCAVAAVSYFVFFRHPRSQAQIVDLSDEPVKRRNRPEAEAKPETQETPAAQPQPQPAVPKPTVESPAKTPETPAPAPVTEPAKTPEPGPPVAPETKTVATEEKTTQAETPPAEPEKPPAAGEATPLLPEDTAPFVNNKPGLLFDPPAGVNLTVRLDFYWPNNGRMPDAKYFAIGAEEDKRFPWTEILLVDARPDAQNGANRKVQIRAKVRGLKALIDKGDPRADRFPVRVYRMFMNDLDDAEPVYANGIAKLYGSAPKDGSGKVKEPDGRRVFLRRIKEIAGEDAVFVSDVIDVGDDPDLNPMKSPLPPPPSFAASDGDVYYTQYHATVGDEEPDAWAFGQAMKALGFVSAGVAHPNSKRFAPMARRGEPYQFSLSAKEILNIRSPESWEDLKDPAAVEATRRLPSLMAGQRDRLKNLGGAKVIGRPVTNGAFVVSTGVQKLVVTAMGANKDGETAWRFPGVVHVTDGTMDQCLIRAPAGIYMFSGHGWDVSANGKSYALINLYPKDNLAAFSDADFTLYVASYLPGNRWTNTLALEENKIILSEKWKKEELRMQWLFLVGCDVLEPGKDPFRKWQSNCGTFGALAMRQLGLKGVLGFSEHGFTSASLMKRFVERAALSGLPGAWLQVFRDNEARAYTWYETNETYGRSKQYGYADLQKKVPAYLIRTEHLTDRLTPDMFKSAAGGDRIEFYELRNGSRKLTGEMNE